MRQEPLAISIVVVAVAWEVVGRAGDLLFLPPLSKVVVALWGLLEDGTIARELRTSLLALAGGMAVAIIAGVTTGALMARFELVRHTLDVYLDAAMAAPMTAFIPVFILLFGLGYATRMVTVIVFAFFPIVVNTFTGMYRPREDLMEMARSFGATPRQLLWQVRLPMAYGHIRAGVRLGMARGVDGLITGEVLIAAVGLGGLVSRFGNAFTMERLWAVVLVIVALALLAIRVTDAVGKLVVRDGANRDPAGSTVGSGRS
jgi:NitT/TauT family transport system permease protein